VIPEAAGWTLVLAGLATLLFRKRSHRTARFESRARDGSLIQTDPLRNR
jgi:hypothetical protein